MTAITALRHYPSGAAALRATYPGVSVDAGKIRDMLGNLALHWIGSATGQMRFGEPLLALYQLYKRCQADGWDGEDGEAISLDTLMEAEKLLGSLPSSVPMPEFLPEATGAIAFEWYRGRDRVFVISVSGAKTIEFAGLFGHGNELHGKTNFEDSLPSIIQGDLREFFRQQVKGQAFDSGAGELLTRYITDPGHIRNSDNSVRHNVFTPSKKTGRLSVYWISDLQEAAIWDIGSIYVAPARGPIIARADLNSLIAYEVELSVEVTGTPHPRHADIVGWDMNSTRTRLQAVKLANSAMLRRVPA